jgi:hypothetical protein
MATQLDRHNHRLEPPGQLALLIRVEPWSMPGASKVVFCSKCECQIVVLDTAATVNTGAAKAAAVHAAAPPRCTRELSHRTREPSRTPPLLPQPQRHKRRPRRAAHTSRQKTLGHTLLRHRRQPVARYRAGDVCASRMLKRRNGGVRHRLAALRNRFQGEHFRRR